MNRRNAESSDARRRRASRGRRQTGSREDAEREYLELLRQGRPPDFTERARQVIEEGWNGQDWRSANWQENSGDIPSERFLVITSAVDYDAEHWFNGANTLAEAAHFLIDALHSEYPDMVSYVIDLMFMEEVPARYRAEVGGILSP